MHFGGVLPEDAPDPRLERAELLKNMPIPVMTFVEQPSVELIDVGVTSHGSGSGMSSITASVTCTLWRNPTDRSDPVNLAELNEVMRRSLDEVPLWPRPTWLVERVERMRYPTIWDGVNTTWNREPSEGSGLDDLLIHHTRHILMNGFQEQLAIEPYEWESPALNFTGAVRHGIVVAIDGEKVVGAEIDTDPFVYAIGADLANGGTLTCVVSREHIPHVVLEFASRN